MQWKIKSVHSWQFGSCLFHWWVIYSPILIQNFSFCCINSLKIQNLLFLLEWFWLHLLISKFKYAECCLYLVGIENYFPICWKRRKYSYDTHAWIWHYWNGLFFSFIFQKMHRQYVHFLQSILLSFGWFNKTIAENQIFKKDKGRRQKLINCQTANDDTEEIKEF